MPTASMPTASYMYNRILLEFSMILRVMVVNSSFDTRSQLRTSSCLVVAFRGRTDRRAKIIHHRRRQSGFTDPTVAAPSDPRRPPRRRERFGREDTTYMYAGETVGDDAWPHTQGTAHGSRSTQQLLVSSQNAWVARIA
eukprot:COSAG02_NODE_2165_length_9612_cov_20.785451_9_plen_139_part_00